MSGTGSKKELYLANSLEDLNKINIDKAKAAFNHQTKCLDILKLNKSSLKLLNEAEHYEMLGDEEKAYVLYMRYLDAVSLVNKLKPTSGKKDIDQKFVKALTKAEQLSSSLKIRYNDRFDKKRLERNPKITPVVKDNVNCIENDSSKPNGLIINGKSIFKKEVNANQISESKIKQSISCTELYHMLYDGNENVTVFDVRSTEEFLKSRMKHLSCVSVPDDILRPGITAAAIERLLPDDSKHMWMKRDQVDFVILMDWNSSFSTLKKDSPLHSLREALTKWSQKVILKSDPFVLENGYEDWVLHYPTETTNPNIKKTHSSLDTSLALLISLDVDYPDPDVNEINDSNSKIEIIDLTDENTIPTSVSASGRRDSIPKIPSVDRALKPQVIVSKPEPKPAWPSEKRVEDEKREIDDSYHRLETMTDEQLRNTVERLNKEHEFALLCMKKENEASEEMRKIMTEEAEQVLEKINSLEVVNKRLEEGRQLLEDENRKLKMKLSHQPDDVDLTRAMIKDKLEEKKKRDAEVEQLRNERKRKEAIKPELKPTSFKKENKFVDSNKNLEIKGEFKTTLKDEPTESKRGLRRSLSSPNIAQLVDNIGKVDINSSISTPIVNRQVKPTNLNQVIPPVNRILKPHETSVVKQRNFNPVYTSQGNSQTGLRNLGNTCFMNSVIQCLANTSGLVNYLLYRDYASDVRASGSEGEVVEELSILLQHLRGGNCRSITPSDFKNIVSRYLKICIGNEQQDAHEFLTKLMEKLHIEINRGNSSSKLPPPETDKLPVSEGIRTYWKWHTARNNSAIQDIFEGLLLSQLTCLYCKSVSNSYEVFSCLSVPISSSSRCSLDACIKNFLKPERISGDAGWNCPTCKQKREAEKQMFIVKLPKVLVIHLKRFSYEGMWRSKLKTMVNFPLSNLEMAPYISEQCKTYQSIYSLYGVVNHFGTLEGGHYIASCKSSNDKWFKYDDQDVSEISSSSVATEAAYIMFYNMVS